MAGTRTDTSVTVSRQASLFQEPPHIMAASSPPVKGSRFLPPFGMVVVLLSTVATLGPGLILLDRAYTGSTHMSDEFKAVRNTFGTPSWVVNALLAPGNTQNVVMEGSRLRGHSTSQDRPSSNPSTTAKLASSIPRSSFQAKGTRSPGVQGRKGEMGSPIQPRSAHTQLNTRINRSAMTKASPLPRKPLQPKTTKAATVSPIRKGEVHVASWWWEAQHEEALRAAKPDSSVVVAHPKEFEGIPYDSQEDNLEFVIQGAFDIPFALAPWVAKGQPLYPRWFNAPRNEAVLQNYVNAGVPHADSELFSRAIGIQEAARKAPLAAGSVPRIAFLFLTKGPLPLAPLWARFFAGHEDLYSIYIHTREGYQYKPGDLPECFKGRQIPSKTATWGTIDTVDAERRLLANSMIDPTNERFVLVSESCIPLYNFPFVYNHLMASQKSYLAIRDVFGPSGRQRWSKEFLPLVKRWQWRKGGQWFQITRPVAEIIVRDTVFYQRFRDHCKIPKCISDEHYLPTMLNVMGVANLARTDLTYADWSQGGAHPQEFGWGDANMRTIVKMRSKTVPGCNSTCSLFGRKFRPRTVGPLLRLQSTGLLWAS